MLNVYNIPAGCSPIVDRLEGHCGIDGVWHFKTMRPLMPGVPHIYNVRFTVLKKGVLVNDVRVVRLIPGRIVDLSY